MLKAKDGSLMPQIPNDTRWNSQVDCLNTFIHNFNTYNDIMETAIQENSGLFPTNVTRILENRAIYREAVHLQKQLKLFTTALDKVCFIFSEFKYSIFMNS